MEGEHARRGREDYEELDRLLMEAEESLEDGDLRGANEALKKAGVKATSMWGEVGRPALPGHTRRLVGLIWEVQRDLSHPGRNSPEALRRDLRELRSLFEFEARRDAGKTRANGRSLTRGGRRRPDRTVPPGDAATVHGNPHSRV